MVGSIRIKMVCIGHRDANGHKIRPTIDENTIPPTNLLPIV